MKQFLVGVAILGGMSIAVLHATDARGATPMPDPYTRPPMKACLTDEGPTVYPSVPCVWNARTMGNHRGHSFRIYRDGRVKLISDERAYELLHGLPNHD